jgi:hypothetical protein
MSQEIRHQPKCYYASAEYAESFRGKYIWIYEDWGGLRLTTEGLTLSTRAGEADIPFGSIKGIALGQFSSLSKPVRLARLTIRYHRDDELRTIHLVPFESALRPVWTTSKLVESWYETLQNVEELTGRFEPMAREPNTFRSVATLAAAAACYVLIFAGSAWLSWVLIRIH